MHFYLIKKSKNHKWSNFNVFQVIVEYIGVTEKKNGRIGALLYMFIISFITFMISVFLL